MINSLKSMFVDGYRLKKVMCKRKQIWSSSVTITFVEAGISIEVEYEYGATVSRATIPSSDATFVGWSSSPSGENPVSSFIATEDKTYYRVVKYSNTTMSTAYTKMESGNSWVSGGSYTISNNIDLSKYNKIVWSYQIRLSLDFSGSTGTVTATLNGSQKQLFSQTGKTSSTKTGTATWEFPTYTTAKSPIIVILGINSSSTGDAIIYSTTVTLYGRTTVA